MADFNESMKAFTDRLKASIDERGESLANTHQATADLINAARMFMEDVALGHELRADEVEAMLSRSHADRTEAVNAMRDRHREDLAAMSDELREMLDENRKTRIDFVADFMTTSQAHRTETTRAMRETHREALASMSKALHQSLDEANKMRLETVGTMRKTFRDAQASLAGDLRGAAMTWRQFASSR